MENNTGTIRYSLFATHLNYLEKKSRLGHQSYLPNFQKQISKENTTVKYLSFFEEFPQYFSSRFQLSPDPRLSPLSMDQGAMKTWSQTGSLCLGPLSPLICSGMRASLVFFFPFPSPAYPEEDTQYVQLGLFLCHSLILLEVFTHYCFFNPFQSGSCGSAEIAFLQVGLHSWPCTHYIKLIFLQILYF